MNFLMDRDAAGWGRDIANLKRQVGECDTSASVTATGALSGEFIWRCAHGRVTGSVLLAPTHPPRIQSIEFERSAFVVTLPTERKIRSIEEYGQRTLRDNSPSFSSRTPICSLSGKSIAKNAAISAVSGSGSSKRTPRPSPFPPPTGCPSRPRS